MKRVAAAAALAGVLLCGCSVTVSTGGSPPTQQASAPAAVPSSSVADPVQARTATPPAASSASSQSCALVGGGGDGPGGAGTIPAQCLTAEINHCANLGGQQRLLCAQGIFYALPQSTQAVVTCIEGNGYGPVAGLSLATRSNTDPTAAACQANPTYQRPSQG